MITIDARDYGFDKNGNSDCGAALNELFKAAPNRSIINIPPGDWDCKTPVVVS